jgi:hypothetical protein
MFGLALIAHLLQVLLLGPWSIFGHDRTAWPHDFHLWLLESALVVFGMLLFGVDRYCDRICRIWQQASPPRRWMALATTMATAQVLLLIGFWSTKDHGVAELGGLRAAFWLGGEWRLPALFSVAQLWLAAWLAWQCARLYRNPVWQVAAVLCAFLGLDELLSIHESIGAAVHAAGLVQTDASKTVAVLGLRIYVWQLVVAPITLLAGIALWVAFARATSPKSTTGLLLGTLAFLAGALGFETVQAGMSAEDPRWWATEAGHFNLLIEEGLEMLGVGIVTLVFAWHYFHACRPAPATVLDEQHGHQHPPLR